MKLKVDDKGNVVLQDGKPVYIKDDGTEVAFDAAGTLATISRLNGEAKGHREAKEAAETKLKAFEGIDDPEAARVAMQTVKNLDGKKLVDAGKVDEIRAEAIKATEAKFAPVVKENDTLKTQLNDEIVGGNFARSKYIGEKLAIPSDLVQARFGKHFSVENGKLVAKDAAGNQIYSATKPGEMADFDEALSIIVNGYPQKEHILKGSGGGGGGAQPANKGDKGDKTLTRTAFDALDPVTQSSKMREGFKVVDAVQ